MPPVVEFVAADHRYYVDDVEVPSVTTVIKDAGLIDTEWFTDQSAIRGTYIHLACRLIDDDELDETTVDERVRPYLDAYQEFMALQKPEWIYVEHRVYDPTYGYAGTLDRAGIIGGQKVLIDIKSGACPPSVSLQLAAYKRCLPQPHTWKRAALNLKPNGTFSLHPCDDRADETVFLAALGLTRWKKRNLK